MDIHVRLRAMNLRRSRSSFVTQKLCGSIAFLARLAADEELPSEQPDANVWRLILLAAGRKPRFSTVTRNLPLALWLGQECPSYRNCTRLGESSYWIRNHATTAAAVALLVGSGTLWTSQTRMSADTSGSCG